MRRIILGSFLCFLSGLFPLFGQSIIKESQTFRSKLLDKEIKYSIYLPDGYFSSEKDYPVLYLLHGYSGNELSWVSDGKVKEITDTSIQNGESVPTIIVMPDAWDSWYINQYDGKCNYEEMFFQELIPFMEHKYRIKSDKQTRSIAGLSMGGQGAFLYTLHHPDYFASCAPLSAAIFDDQTLKQRIDSQDKNDLFKRLIGEDLNHWKKNSILDLLQSAKTNVRYYIDCGDDDYLLQGTLDAHRIMQEKGIKHELRVRDGAHNWEYWRSALPEVLKFISHGMNN